MALKEIIMHEIIQAMKNKDKQTKGVLQLVKAGLDRAEKEKKAHLTESEEHQVIQREIKQTKEFLAEAEKANRKELIVEANEKIVLLQRFLPKQLSESEVRDHLVRLGVHANMNMGEAMKVAMPSLSGKAANSIISKVVKDILS